MEGSIKGDFCFGGCDGQSVAPLMGSSPGTAATSTQVVLGNTATQRPAIVTARPDDSDTALWNAVEHGNTIDDYGAYLQQYPKGKYAVLARQRTQKLLEQAAADARATEDAAWQVAESAGSEAGYQRYLSAYPKGRYSLLIAPRISKLRAVAEAREDADC